MPANPPNGWPYAESPFHRGERAVQERVGVLDEMDPRGRRAIRTFMPDEHRAFFAKLPFAIVGTIDGEGQPWASVLSAAPGFIQSPDPLRLAISARPLAADPLSANLRTDAPIALLGIEPHTRRRNRASGAIEQLTSAAFTVRVYRSFGNCPKYIQARVPLFIDESPPQAHRPIAMTTTLDTAMSRLIRTADTFFIATAFTAEDAQHACPHGVDVSHRGGKPGFVRIDDNRTLTLPDFVGNFYFNTIGNLLLHPRAGLLFIDFASGDLLYLAVNAEIIWTGDEVKAFAGAERLLRLRIQRALHLPNAFPLRWSDAQLSPFLARTGDWGEAIS